ncbi:hypothetical protein [[Bacillus] enclensis]|uniref:hypothetical protein n=1 Tax=[Bacillus] enclensis TaxID=1402860 RepID=UPI0018DC0BEE|nr:hypothetical protein [[Bacillus] enclensis]MBH9968477.1 hypothetical protein [[Bacillus] enclensis]
MKNKTVLFKESRIIQTTFLLIMVGFIYSFIPYENWLLLGMNMGLAGLCCVIFTILWRYNRNHSKRYFSLLSYVMLITLSLYFTIPLLRVFVGSFLFWLTLLLLAACTLIPYFFSESIAKGVQNPSMSKMGKIYLIMSMLIVAFGTILLFYVNLQESQDAFVVALFSFGLAVLFLFIAPIFLITPERVKELDKA